MGNNSSDPSAIASTSFPETNQEQPQEGVTTELSPDLCESELQTKQLGSIKSKRVVSP